MIDPIAIGEDAVVDREALVGWVRREGRLCLFLRSGQVMTVSDTLSREERDELTRKTN